MLYTHCLKRQTKTPKFGYCNSCYVVKYRHERPGYAHYGRNGFLATERANSRCERCRSKGKLHIHHLDGKGRKLPYTQQNNSLSNLMVLCIPCHSEVEQGRRTDKAESVFRPVIMACSKTWFLQGVREMTS